MASHSSIGNGPAHKRIRTGDTVPGPPLAAEINKSVSQKYGSVPGRAITLQEIQTDRITQVAAATWSTSLDKSRKPQFDAALVKRIYNDELKPKEKAGRSVPLQRVMLLEISQYLENYLWPNFDGPSATFEHIMSILLMVNEKFRENVAAWTCFHDREQVFQELLHSFTTLKQGERKLSRAEKVNYLVFTIHCFQSLEDEMVRKQVLRMVSLPLWHALSPKRREKEFREHKDLETKWKARQKRDAKAVKAGNLAADPMDRPEVSFIPSLVEEFLEMLDNVLAVGATAETKAVDRLSLLYCERFLEFGIDLLSQLPTRRFVHALFEDRVVLVKCRLSALYSHPAGRLFSQLVDLLRFYLGFEIDDHSGAPVSDAEMHARYYRRLAGLQRVLFRHAPLLRDVAMAPLAQLGGDRNFLAEQLGQLDSAQMAELAVERLALAHPSDPWLARDGFLRELLVTAFERRPSQFEAVNTLPLYPTEAVMWDESLIPSAHFSGEGCLALPKLNLQFLTLHDYLLRNFHLFRLESTYEIREEVADAVKRLAAREGPEGEALFGGWARMAVALEGFEVREVTAPKLGETAPGSARAEAKFRVANFQGAARSEWDGLKEHDVVFLLTLEPRGGTPPGGAAGAEGEDPEAVPSPESELHRMGLVHVRGAEVIEMRDETWTLMNDFTGRVKREDWRPPAGVARTAVLALDTAQYALDMAALESGALARNPYTSFNAMLRRKPKENNFKAILESIRDLMNEEAIMPEWLHDVFLGYGDPAAAGAHSLPAHARLRTVDFKDTFLSESHLRRCFPGRELRLEGPRREPPFRLTFPEEEGSREAGAAGPIVAEGYEPADPGPFPEDKPPQNSVEFTPAQVSAVYSGVQPGLTMVVGPPGTGKTDTAVQILQLLYHNCPNQRTLLITHSNQALNDIFEKIMQRDVPARYLLRLGLGEAELGTEQSFSRQGRVNAMLARRLQLLAEVERLARSLDVAGDVAQTCETAAHFWLLHVLARWEAYQAECASSKDKDPSVVRSKFPFREFFTAAGVTLFQGSANVVKDEREAAGCFTHLRRVFTELEECRAFELLKTTADRSNYLMTRQAKIVAMTCTHAALKRRDFLALGLTYDNLLMEEAAQILEIETFIPMLLQRATDGHARLKRAVLIGDHHQLPPVVKNLAFQKFSHMDQSLFTRFVRLGTPYVELNAQGRMRPSLARLFNWRYRSLGNLPAVQRGPPSPFAMANPGFAHEFQLVDVPDHEGRGESEPNPYFYQNLGEAEYVVSVFQYMRLLGYPASSIAVLTTYNGQKHLIRDVIEQRCAQHPLFGRPAAITTVDRFQGQQADYVLLSLVRTRAVGHLRDVRRLVVALSRARLGLYVFARRALFEQCYELAPAFQQLLALPDRLALVLADAERPFSAPRPLHEARPPPGILCAGLQEMALIVERLWVRTQACAAAEAERAWRASQSVAAMRAHAGGALGQPPPAGPGAAEGGEGTAQPKDQVEEGAINAAAGTTKSSLVKNLTAANEGPSSVVNTPPPTSRTES